MIVVTFCFMLISILLIALNRIRYIHSDWLNINSQGTDRKAFILKEIHILKLFNSYEIFVVNTHKKY